VQGRSILPRLPTNSQSDRTNKEAISLEDARESVFAKGKTVAHAAAAGPFVPSPKSISFRNTAIVFLVNFAPIFARPRKCPGRAGEVGASAPSAITKLPMEDAARKDDGRMRNGERRRKSERGGAIESQA